MVDIVKIVRSGTVSSRVALKDGSTTLIKNSKLEAMGFKIPEPFRKFDGPKFVDLGRHFFDGKSNLVTKTDKHGSYDTYKCVHCGRVFKNRGLGGIMDLPGKCMVPAEVFEKFKAAKEAEAASRAEDIYGTWCPTERPARCPQCKSTLTLCPREGHHMSKYWSKERDDGQSLHICPKGCPE